MHHLRTIDLSSWYAVHTHLKQEDRASNNLSTLGIETLTPRIKKCRRNVYTGEVTHVGRPFFPNYVFVRFDIHQHFHKVRLTRGVHSVVSYGTTPAQVDRWIIAAIQSRIGEDGYVMIGENLKPGDEVVIEGGPMKDLQGVFERETSDADRVMILLQAITYQAHLVVDRESLRKIGQSGLNSTAVK
ncbi:MAG TPA: transcription termination/antitermination NusG family protein [Blastocatellia bacterium]|nr:transcription termination/antitermination NusG family protein [Blastocatellia bacterium]